MLFKLHFKTNFKFNVNDRSLAFQKIKIIIVNKYLYIFIYLFLLILYILLVIKQ